MVIASCVLRSFEEQATNLLKRKKNNLSSPFVSLTNL